MIKSKGLTLTALGVVLGLIAVRCGYDEPAKADTPAECLVTRQMFTDLSTRARDTELFPCQGELVYDTGNANMPSNRRNQIWRFKGVEGHFALIHTWRGRVVEKLWQ